MSRLADSMLFVVSSSQRIDQELKEKALATLEQNARLYFGGRPFPTALKPVYVLTDLKEEVAVVTLDGREFRGSWS